MRKLKEILQQEFEFKTSILEKNFHERVVALEEQALSDSEAKLQQKESEMKEKLAAERARMEREIAKKHSEMTVEISEEVQGALRDKYSVEVKAKISQIQARLKSTYEEKMAQLQSLQAEELGKERQKNSKTEEKLVE